MLNCAPPPLSYAPSARNRSRSAPSVPQHPARCFSTSRERERVVPGRHRRVRREDRRRANLFERLVEAGAAARSGRGCAAARRTPRGLRSGGRRAGSMPSAFSARTPPMPRMISCWTRVSRSPPYSRADSSRSHGAFSSRSVSSRYSVTRPSCTRQTATSTDAIAERHGRDARLAVRRQRRLDRRVGPVEPLVALFLPPFGRHVLVEVALRIHEADADERHAEVARFLAVIAGQHAEAAGVDRQRLMQRELGREIRDRSARRAAGSGSSTRCSGPRGRRRAPRWRGRRGARNSGSRGRGLEPRRAGRATACAPGCAPSRARACSRAGGTPSRASRCQLHQRSVASSSRRLRRSGSGGSAGVSCSSGSMCTDERRESGRSMLPPETTATTLPGRRVR